MLLGCIADDFTGASDLANTLAKGGMRTMQFNGVPHSAVSAGCEAGVVSLKSRSIPAKDAVDQSLSALAWLQEQGCEQFLFKYCSTFDSTAEGNIGPVAEALLAALDEPYTIVCPAFPAAGRTIYQGYLFVGDRLLNEFGMERHPLNPMTDADIARWLGLQTELQVGRIGYRTVRGGAAGIGEALRARREAGDRLLVVDAIEDADLHAIGHAARDLKLITGGSGIALGLPENFRVRGLLTGGGESFETISGPGAVLSGSCSKMSISQVEDYLNVHPGLPVSAADLLNGAITVKTAVEFVTANLERDPIVYSTAAPDEVAAVQQTYGRARVAHEVEAFFGHLASALVAAGIRRLVVGGGETSGAVVTALSPEKLLVGPEIDPGVPALGIMGERPMRLALKSGNFGTVDFFTKALTALGKA